MKPNQMPKRQQSKIRQQMIAGLIETKPTSWNRKTLAKDEDGKEVVNNRMVRRDELRFPLAQNVSEESVERLAKRWL